MEFFFYCKKQPININTKYFYMNNDHVIIIFRA